MIYDDAKEYNKKYITNGRDVIHNGSSGANYCDLYTKCYELKSNTLDILAHNNYYVPGDCTANEYNTVVYCKLYEWYHSLPEEEQVTLALLGVVL